MPEVIHVMGGKIDNIFDVEDELDIVLSTSPANIALAKK
jgi:hypothetical protein